jgi:hypothetical protein
MASIEDWAAKAARKISENAQVVRRAFGPLAYPAEEEIAAIIATFAEPLVKLLRESRREHYHCDDSYYCCGACDAEDHGPLGGGFANREGGVCNCGADEWNKRIEEALS